MGFCILLTRNLWFERDDSFFPLSFFLHNGVQVCCELARRRMCFCEMSLGIILKFQTQKSLKLDFDHCVLASLLLPMTLKGQLVVGFNRFPGG